MNPLRTSWGHILRQKKDESDDTLTRKVIKIFNFLFKSVLRSIVNEDTTFNISELTSSESIQNMAKRTQSGLINSAERVMQQIFEVLFSNVERYLDVLRRFGPGL